MINFHSEACGDTLFMLHFNVRSLTKIIHKLLAFVEQLVIELDVIAITETKLNSTNYNVNLHLSGYVFIQKNQPEKN